MSEHLTRTVEQKRISAFKNRFVLTDSCPCSFEVTEKYLRWRWERTFEVHLAETQIDASFHYPDGIGRFQRWFGRSNLAGNIFQGGVSLGSARLDPSASTIEIFDAMGSVAWKCSPLFPRRLGTSIGIFSQDGSLHGKVYGQNDDKWRLSSIWTSQWKAGVISNEMAMRMSSPDPGLLLFLFAFAATERLIATEIHSE